MHTAQASRWGDSGVEKCWFSLAGAGFPALAVGVDKAGAVRCGLVPAGGHVLLGDRFAGGAMPLFPFGGAVWLAVGVQEQVLAPPAGNGAWWPVGLNFDAYLPQMAVVSGQSPPPVGNLKIDCGEY
jgi:hypothetical protein